MTRLISSLKNTELNFNFGKVLVVLTLTFTMLFQGVMPVSANPNIKTMTVTIGEGGADQSSLSKIVNIPNLQSIESITTDTGSVNHSISGENVTLNVSGGSPSRSVNNPYKYSKHATDYSTSSSNSFDSTKSYNSGGYSGSLYKDGSSYLYTGSYTPSDTKYVTAQTSPNYNSGGYVGTLDKYVYSGSYTPADSRTEETTRTFDYISLYKAYNGQWLDAGSGWYRPPLVSSVFFNSGGYSGTLNYTSSSETSNPTMHLKPTSQPDGATLEYVKSTLTRTYSGTVTRPASDTRVYRYQGYVTKPASDTRVYRQDYSGTVYKAGTDYFYKYIVTIEYIDNQNPILTTVLPNANSYFGKEPGHNSIFFEGTVKDDDENDVLNISYTLHNNNTNTDLEGHTNKIFKSGLPSGIAHDFEHDIEIDDTIPEGEYILKIITKDDKGGTATDEILINVDKTPPGNFELEAAADSISEITITGSAQDNDNGSGLQQKPYSFKINNEAWSEWTDERSRAYTGLNANEQYSFTMRVIDKVDNIGFLDETTHKYTRALNPTKIILESITDSSLTFKIIDTMGDAGNTEIPGTKLSLRLGTETIEETSWSVEETKVETFNNLDAGETYKLFVNTRNGDDEENGEIEAGTENIPLVFVNEDGIEEEITEIKMKPAAPELVSNECIAVSNSEIKIKWNSVESAENYHIEYKQNDSSTWETLDIVDNAGDLEITIKNLEVNTQYDFRVKAENSTGFSEYSEVSKYTLANPPINISYSNIKQTELTINWEANENPEYTKYEVERKLSTENNDSFTKITEIVGLEFVDTGLIEGETYAYQIRAVNGDGILSDYELGSDIVTVPQKPTIGSVEPLKDNENTKSIMLYWEPVDGATKYALYVVPEDGAKILINDDIRDTTFTHAGLDPNREYTYYLQTGNDSGFSEDSESKTRVTQALSVKGTTGLKVESTTATTATFEVVNNSGNHKDPETKIEIKDISTQTVVATSPFSTDTINRELTGLTQDVEYEVWVTTRNNDEPENFKIENGPELIFNSFYSNRKPELQNITLSEGSHHQGKPLEITVLTKEFDIGDKIKVFYTITGMLTAQDKQIADPLESDPYNYTHNSTIAEYKGYIHFDGSEESGIYEITFWVEDSAGLKSDTVTKTFRLAKSDYFLEEIKDIVEDGTDEDIKDALEVVLGEDFDEFYYPDPLQEHIIEEDYLDIVKDEIKDLNEPVTADDIRIMMALVNINSKLSFGEESTITKKEIVTILDNEKHRYKDNYLNDYQNELKRMYGRDGQPIMRLDEIDVLNAIKLINFNRLPVNSITADIIEDLIGDEPPVNNKYLEDYKNAIEDLRETNDNPTLEEIQDVITIVNINKKIEIEGPSFNDLKEILPDTDIKYEYSSEYLRYLRMYKEDLRRNLELDDIKAVIESVNAVRQYEKNPNDENRNEAFDKIGILVNGSVKDELTARITPLDKPGIDNDGYENTDKDDVIDFLDNPTPLLINLNGQKTIVSSSPAINLNSVSLGGANEIRYIVQENGRESYTEWKPVKDNKFNHTLVYNDQGTYRAGIQVRNSFGTLSEVEDINIIVDWTAPKGELLKSTPSQTAVRGDNISLRIIAEDNLKLPMYIKLSGSWIELPDGHFEYRLSPGAGEKLIEIELADIAGNKTVLYNKVWKVD